MKYVKWPSMLCANIENLRDKNILCDTEVVGSDGRKQWAHSCVLASASPVLHDQLIGKTAPYSVYVEGISGHIWEYVLRFLYIGEMQSSNKLEAEMILEAAQKLNIEPLGTLDQEWAIDDNAVADDLPPNLRPVSTVITASRTCRNSLLNNDNSACFEKIVQSRAKVQKKSGCSANRTNDNREKLGIGGTSKKIEITDIMPWSNKKLHIDKTMIHETAADRDQDQPNSCLNNKSPLPTVVVPKQSMIHSFDGCKQQSKMKHVDMIGNNTKTGPMGRSTSPCFRRSTMANSSTSGVESTWNLALESDMEVVSSSNKSLRQTQFRPPLKSGKKRKKAYDMSYLHNYSQR